MTMDPSYIRELRDSLDIATVERWFGDTWHIFRAAGSWCALRRGGGTVMWNGPKSLIRPVLCAERLDDLAEQMCVQALLDRLNPADLERVYATGEIPDDLFTYEEGAEA
jgi:hypothetical protein